MSRVCDRGWDEPSLLKGLGFRVQGFRAYRASREGLQGFRVYRVYRVSRVLRFFVSGFRVKGLGCSPPKAIIAAAV